MTTFKVKVDNENDLKKLIEFLDERSIPYQIIDDEEDHIGSVVNEGEVEYGKADLIEDEEDFIYTEELKRQLDEDEEAYQRGELRLITPEESRAEIQKILNGLK